MQHVALMKVAASRALEIFGEFDGRYLGKKTCAFPKLEIIGEFNAHGLANAAWSFARSTLRTRR